MVSIDILAAIALYRICQWVSECVCVCVDSRSMVEADNYRVRNSKPDEERE